MPKFRKKPVEIEAHQFRGNDICETDLLEWIGEDAAHVEFSTDAPPKLIIETLEGDMEATAGDWIIKGIKGEFYPCKPDIFEKTYGETEALIKAAALGYWERMSEQRREEHRCNVLNTLNAMTGVI